MRDDAIKTSAELEMLLAGYQKYNEGLNGLHTFLFETQHRYRTSTQNRLSDQG